MRETRATQFSRRLTKEVPVDKQAPRCTSHYITVVECTGRRGGRRKIGRCASVCQLALVLRVTLSSGQRAQPLARCISLQKKLCSMQVQPLRPRSARIASSGSAQVVAALVGQKRSYTVSERVGRRPGAKVGPHVQPWGRRRFQEHGAAHTPLVPAEVAALLSRRRPVYHCRGCGQRKYKGHTATCLAAQKLKQERRDAATTVAAPAAAPAPPAPST